MLKEEPLLSILAAFIHIPNLSLVALDQSITVPRLLLNALILTVPAGYVEVPSEINGIVKAKYVAVFDEVTVTVPNIEQFTILPTLV